MRRWNVDVDVQMLGFLDWYNGESNILDNKRECNSHIAVPTTSYQMCKVNIKYEKVYAM